MFPSNIQRSIHDKLCKKWNKCIAKLIIVITINVWYGLESKAFPFFIENGHKPRHWAILMYKFAYSTVRGTSATMFSPWTWTYDFHGIKYIPLESRRLCRKNGINVNSPHAILRFIKLPALQISCSEKYYYYNLNENTSDSEILLSEWKFDWYNGKTRVKYYHKSEYNNNNRIVRSEHEFKAFISVFYSF